MNRLFTFLVAALPLGLWAQVPDVYDEKVTSAANVSATISNLGLVGNAFSGSFNVLGYPSCEYPAGSGIEHVFQGGLWVGGYVDGELGVSTACVDDATGYATGKAGFEFTSKSQLSEKSSLITSPFYNPTAISHQDLSSVFTDTSFFVYGGSVPIPISGHDRPLGLKVNFESYNWNYSFANFFVIMNYTIENISNKPVDSLYFGMWIDGVVRNVNITRPGGSAFFNKSGNGYIDSLQIGYEFDAAGDIGFTDSYVGTKLLGIELNGACPSSPNFRINYNTWQFQNSSDPLFFYPTTEIQKYEKLSSGLNYNAGWDNTIQGQINSANNRSNLISCGPVSRLMPGEKVQIAFAVVCAKRVMDGNPASANTPAQRANLVQNAQWSQTAYYGEDTNRNCILDQGEDKNGDGKITRFVLPAPPEIPKMKVVADDHKIEVYWAKNAESSIDPISNLADFEGYRLYKTAVGYDMQNTTDILKSLNLVGEWDTKGDGVSFETGMEKIKLATPMTFEGDTNKYYYKYVFDNISNGWQHVVALTAYDKGDEVNRLESLESASLANLKHVFPGKPANKDLKTVEPFAYPNPYYANAAWEGASTLEEDRKLIFANLPKRAEVRIYTLAGDLVDVFEHDAATYTGSDINWFNTYSESEKTVFSGGEHAWDLLSADQQLIARGLYLFVVRDLESGKTYKGKFVIVK